jgi:hypothetical protein
MRWRVFKYGSGAQLQGRLCLKIAEFYWREHRARIDSTGIRKLPKATLHVGKSLMMGGAQGS